MQVNFNISALIEASARTYPEKDAVSCGGTVVSYCEFASAARRLAGQIAPRLSHGRCGVLASRSIEACVAIIGAAWAGGIYVPLSLKYPEARIIELLEMLDLDVLIVDRAGLKLLSENVRARCPKLVLVPRDNPDGNPGEFVADHGATGELETGEMEAGATAAPALIGRDDLAYIEFTSGTTGKPKGVMVSAGAVANYIEAMCGWYDFGPDDRAAETCDITFDLSVHNMLMIWQAGGCLHIMRPLDLVTPVRFINKHRITTWLSVPSLVAISRQAADLAPGSLPSLRISLFCGEPLPAEVARDWMAAAPNSVVDNIYGPTEATIACLRQPWSEGGVVTRSRDVVAIGAPYPGMKTMIVDSENNPLPDGVPGEIALGGAQLAEGYFGQHELTAQRFPIIDGARWYLTGDRGYRDEHGVFHHLGRLDNQVKINGHRVELEEIDTGIRFAANAGMACAVAWPVAHGSATGVVGFCAGTSMEGPDIRARLRDRLPPHMVPTEVRVMETLPLNGNGKVDRKALFAWLEEESARTEIAS